jgi:hypothetical protein
VFNLKGDAIWNQGEGHRNEIYYNNFGIFYLLHSHWYGVLNNSVWFKATFWQSAALATFRPVEWSFGMWKQEA